MPSENGTNITSNVKNSSGNNWTNKSKKAMKDGFNKTKETYQNTSTWKKIWILLLLIIIIIIIWYWASSAKSNSDWRSKYEPILISSPVNAYSSSLSNKKVTVPNSDEGLQFSYSCWLYIADWNYKFGYWKSIIVKGDSTSGWAPGIWLYPKTNAIHARITTYADPNEGCDVHNIPLQKWVHFVYILNNRTVDIYINGKLERSCVLKGVPNINTKQLEICGKGDTPAPGFYGQISRLQYFATAITPNKVMKIYNDGPLGSTKYKVNFFKDGKVVSTSQESGINDNTAYSSNN